MDLRRPVAIALAAAFACAMTGSFAASSYSESVGINTPDKHIAGSAVDQDRPAAQVNADQQLLDKVVSALVDDAQTKGADIRVAVQGGKVTLSGKSTDQAQADHVRQVAENLAGRDKVTSSVAPKG